MATERDLFLSILALDAYNRGYDPGMAGLSDAIGSAIGQATISATPQDIDAAQAASFYAVAYSWAGETVISYRGTDNELLA